MAALSQQEGPSLRRPRVEYLSVHDSNYPRNRRIRASLVAAGYDVERVEIDASVGYRRNFLRLTRVLYSRRGRPDIVVLAEFSLQFFVLAYLRARWTGAIYVVDRFIGLVETRVEDHEGGTTLWKRRIYSWIDRCAVRGADLVLVDTEVRAMALQRSFNLKERPVVLPVGAPSWARPQRAGARVPENEIRVLYYGNFISLHGVPIIIAAVDEAAENRRVTLTLVGNGPGLSRARQLVATARHPEVFHFAPSVPEQDLAGLIHAHDVILGVFGDSPKAKSVIANKVWQGLACGKPVVTRRSGALDEISQLVEGLLHQVTDPRRELASALGNLILGGTVPDRVDEQLEGYVWSRYESFHKLLRARLYLRGARAPLEFPPARAGSSEPGVKQA